MKKLYTLLLLTASFTFIATSCKKNIRYETGEPDAAGCYEVYFPQQKREFVFASSSPKNITVTVARKKTTGAIAVPIAVIERTNTLTITPSAVTFADGENETTFDLFFEGAKVDTTYIVDIIISDPQYASKYNNEHTTFGCSILIENYHFIAKVQYFDGLIYFINDDIRENLQIEKVELYQKEGTNLFRIVDPFANREAIENVWGPGSTTDDRSKKWEFEMLDDKHLKYDKVINIGLLYQQEENKYTVVYEMPSKLHHDGDDKILYNEEAKLFMLEPFAFLPDLGNGFGQQNVWVGANADVDIAALLGL